MPDTSLAACYADLGRAVISAALNDLILPLNKTGNRIKRLDKEDARWFLFESREMRLWCCAAGIDCVAAREKLRLDPRYNTMV